MSIIYYAWQLRLLFLSTKHYLTGSFQDNLQNLLLYTSPYTKEIVYIYKLSNILETIFKGFLNNKLFFPKNNEKFYNFNL